MELTKVLVFQPNDNAPDWILASAQITLDDMIVIKNISLVKSKAGEAYLKICSFKKPDGEWADGVYFLDRAFHDQVRDAILHEMSTSKTFLGEAPKSKSPNKRRTYQTTKADKKGGSFKDF